jgi:hypothetical protein
MSDKNKSIQDKINEIKNRKKLTDREKKMKELKDKSIRSNNQSKLKITFSNDILTNHKLILWITSNEIMKYSIINGNEEIEMDNEMYDKVLDKIDSLLIDYMELLDSKIDNDTDYDLENIFLSIDIYEDMEIDNCEVYKRNKIYDNVNLVVLGLVVFNKLYEDTDNEDLGDIKSNVFRLIMDSMVKLDKIRVGECKSCECCMENSREETIKITGRENIDRLESLGINVNELKLVKSKMGEDREESINNLINTITDKKE